MSVRLLSVVWDGFPGGGSDLLAMLAFADWSDDDGRCWPSMAAIASKARLSRSQAQRVVHGLISAGYLSVTGNETGGAPGSTRQYRINVATLTGRASATPTGRTNATGSVHATGRTGAQEGPHPCGETGRTHATQTVSEPSVNRQHTPDAKNPRRVISPPPDKSEPEGFADCWSAYPKREGGNSRADALKAYRGRLKAGASPADLLAGVKRYASYCQAKGMVGTSFVKQASTFFGPGDHWKETWSIPSALPTQEHMPKAGEQRIRYGIAETFTETAGWISA